MPCFLGRLKAFLTLSQQNHGIKVWGHISFLTASFVNTAICSVASHTTYLSSFTQAALWTSGLTADLWSVSQINLLVFHLLSRIIFFSCSSSLPFHLSPSALEGRGRCCVWAQTYICLHASVTFLIFQSYFLLPLLTLWSASYLWEFCGNKKRFDDIFKTTFVGYSNFFFLM